MKERIRKIRKELDLTQQVFADRLGIKRGAVANYELGRNIPIDAVLSLICREFNVREEWLRTGEGEMFRPEPSSILGQLAEKYRLSNAEYAMIDKFLSLDPRARMEVFSYCRDLAAALDGTDPYAPAYTGNAPTPAAGKENTDSVPETGGTVPETVGSVPERTVEELEEEYKKSRLNAARKTGPSALNSTGGGTKGA